MEEAMLAQARSADRHRQEEYNKQTKKMATGAIRKGCKYWGGGKPAVTGPGKAAKSRR